MKCFMVGCLFVGPSVRVAGHADNRRVVVYRGKPYYLVEPAAVFLFRFSDVTERAAWDISTNNIFPGKGIQQFNTDLFVDVRGKHFLKNS